MASTDYTEGMMSLAGMIVRCAGGTLAVTLTMVLAAACPRGQGEDTVDGEAPDPSWRSVLYPEGWTPDHSLPDGRFLHDFSYAGHRAGE